MKAFINQWKDIGKWKSKQNIEASYNQLHDQASLCQK